MKSILLLVLIHPSRCMTIMTNHHRPAMIRSDTIGTWAYDTMSRRVNEEILERTVIHIEDDLAKPEFQAIRRNIIMLRKQLEESSVLPKLEDPHDVYDAALMKETAEWRRLLAPYANDTWLTAPWLIAEFYVYRRLMQALDYWNPVSPGFMYDPFRTAKTTGLVNSVDSAELCLSRIPNLPSTPKGLELAVGFALWGNQMDLSLWPAGADNAATFAAVLDAATDQLLADDSKALSFYCFERTQLRIDIIVDNAGFELVTDLALAQYLIESGIAKQVTFQLKAHPTFVSDALTKDLLDTVSYYESSIDANQYPACHAAATKWRDYLNSGQWKCHEDFFWVQPFAMAWEMTEPLRSTMEQQCDLAFVKGDANYRRLMGDREWEWDTPFQDIVQEFPVPICALRTLKAELGCGMSKEQTDRASAADPNWMTNGRFGVVQFAMNKK